ncbi:MAG: GAF domain-containing sensor histidine kinase [Acidobacteriota bacterium]
MNRSRDPESWESPEFPLQRWRWAAIAAPLLLTAVLMALLWAFAEPAPWAPWALAAIALVAVIFYAVVFSRLEGYRRRLERRNQELELLRRAALNVGSELSLEVVLERLVEQATQLLGTRYGALSVLGEDDAIKTFVTVGIGRAAADQIGSPPVGRGLLGISLHRGETLRLGDLTLDPRACGFPDHHPRMSTLLAVPLACQSPYRGNLYLSEKIDGRSFDREDEETLIRFAAQAAMAVDNAHLHSQVGSVAVAEERLRLAHELHDGQAQVLAFVNAKAQAVREFLRSESYQEARRQLDQLAEAARGILADVREGILGLRSVGASGPLLDNLRQYLELWQEQARIEVEARLEPIPELPPGVELQILRILQEALTNVRKHAGTDRVRVALEPWGRGLRLEIDDRGRGFTAGASGPVGIPRFGLATMRERAQAISAQLDVTSEPGRGTRVRLQYEPDPTTSNDGLLLAGLDSSDREGESA